MARACARGALVLGFLAWGVLSAQGSLWDRFGALGDPVRVLRWLVRQWDSEVVFDAASVGWSNGQMTATGVRIGLAGRVDPFLTIDHLVAGLGDEWTSGKIGSVVLRQPRLRIDAETWKHFAAPGTAKARTGFGPSWQVGRVEIDQGHVWVAALGDPALDVSLNLQGVLHDVGGQGAAGSRLHTVGLTSAYVAVHDEGQVVPLLGVGRALVRFRIAELMERTLEGLRIENGWLLAGEGLRRLLGNGGSHDAASPQRAAWMVRALDLDALDVRLADLGEGVPDVGFRLNTALRDVGSQQAARDLADQEHHVEVADLQIMSPLDPLTRVLTVRSIVARFTLEGLLQRRVRSLEIIEPVVYIDRDLFWYMQRVQAGGGGTEAVSAVQGWQADHLAVNFGRLVVAAGGRERFGLPLAFRTTAEDVSLASLAGLNLNLVLEVPRQDYRFPAYALELNGVQGNLRFNYPPEKSENNLVNVLRLHEARWRQFRGRDLWLSVTFDREGINGLFGGAAYEGYLSGGFSFFFQPEWPWTGWIAGTGVDLGQLTSVLAPQNFLMTGRASAKVEVNGLATVVDRVLGSVVADEPGRMTVSKLDEFLPVLPRAWGSLRRDSVRIALESLRDFDYDRAKVMFWYLGDEGVLEMRMKGPRGSRNLDLALHRPGEVASSQKKDSR